MASGFTFGNTIRKRMGLPPLFLSPSYFTPVLPLFEQSLRQRYLDNRDVHQVCFIKQNDPFQSCVTYHEVPRGQQSNPPPPLLTTSPPHSPLFPAQPQPCT